MATQTAETPATTTAAPGYTVLARRYRSRMFDEVVGQEPIARTLKNAVETGRTAHAYLFTGTRGVGKTSMARILATALNVTDDLAQKKEITDAILRGDDLDVIEIDGASNRGIADAKELIAGAGLSPARCRYKIYIIDEVHALTRDAFNALLKTMEEPPAHVKFILCTTEVHKVPPTIQSRCQRFDFRPIPTAKIAEQLRMILQKEGIDADDDVVVQVAQLGNGSMRDALSMLDRLLASGETTLTASLLEQMLGLPEQSLIVELVQAVIDGDPRAALTKSDELLRTGATIEQILDMLAQQYRTLMLVAACGEETDLLELSQEQEKIAREQARHFDAAALVHLIALCDAIMRNVRTSAVDRALFDAAIVRMCLAERFMDIDAALKGGEGRPAVAAAQTSKSSSTPSARTGGTKKKDLERAKQPLTHHETAQAPAQPVHSQPPQSTAQPSRPTPSVTELKPAGSSDEQAAAPTDGESIWAKVQQHVSGKQMGKVMIEHLEFESYDGRTLRLRIAEHGASVARYLQMQLDNITAMVRNVAGPTAQVQLVGEPSADEPRSKSDDQLNQARDLPSVRQAMDIFDASIIAVQDAAEEPSVDETGER